MDQVVKVGLIGFGTVGTGVVKILRDNADIIARRVGRNVVLDKIADLDITTDRGVSVPSEMLGTTAMILLMCAPKRCRERRRRRWPSR